jgi:GNAT superfamily N-acetyltransferase
MSLSESIRLTVHDDETPVEAAAVVAGLDAANEQVAALRDVRPLSVFARDAGGGLIGGAVGRTWGECCELRFLWVDERQRGSGVGTRLLRAFEARAAERDCRLVYLETFSFQARPFYEELGYEVALEITGFAAGIGKCVMTRRLAPG